MANISVISCNVEVIKLRHSSPIIFFALSYSLLSLVNDNCFISEPFRLLVNVLLLLLLSNNVAIIFYNMLRTVTVIIENIFSLEYIVIRPMLLFLTDFLIFKSSSIMLEGYCQKIGLITNLKSF